MDVRDEMKSIQGSGTGNHRKSQSKSTKLATHALKTGKREYSIAFPEHVYIVLEELADRNATTVSEIARRLVVVMVYVAEREPVEVILRREGFPDETLFAPL